MHQQTNEEMREEFHQRRHEFVIRHPEGINLDFDKTADFWLKKIDELLTSQRENLRKEIEGMKHEIKTNDARKERNAIYRNSAFDQVLSLLHSHYNHIE